MFIALLFIQMSPWFSPIKIIARMPYDIAVFIHGFAVCMGFIIPGLILAYMYKRTEKQVKIKEK